MDKIGLLAQVIPQVSVMYGVHQGGYHHLDVWQHPLQAVRELEKLIEEMGGNKRMKAYLHRSMAGGTRVWRF